MKNALVLGAGGVAGAFQAGALSVLLKKEEYAPAGIFGSSAGALNGAFLADRAGRAGGPIDWARIGEELVDFWRNEITEPGKLWIQGGNAGQGHRGVYRTQANPPGPGPGNPPLFWDIIREQIDPNNLRKAEEKGVAYTAGAVDLIRGDIRYPSVDDPDIVDYIIASTAIPVLFDSRDITRDNAVDSFVDGGTRDVAPVSAAVKMGYDNIACVICHPFTLKPAATSFEPRNLEHLIGRIFSIVINETVNNDVSTIDLIKRLLTSGALEKQPAPVRQALSPYLQLKSATIIRPRSNSRAEAIDDFAFGTDDIKAVIDEGIEAAGDLFDKSLPSPAFAPSAAKSPGGSYIMRWDQSE